MTFNDNYVLGFVSSFSGDFTTYCNLGSLRNAQFISYL